jgi:hypothetical protein
MQIEETIKAGEQVEKDGDSKELAESRAEVERLKAENESLKKAPPAQPAPVCEARRGWLDEVAAENERRLAGR